MNIYIWEKSPASSTMSSSSGEKRNVKIWFCLLQRANRLSYSAAHYLQYAHACIDCISFGDSLSLCDVRSRAVFISREKEIMFKWKMMHRNRKAVFRFWKGENIRMLVLCMQQATLQSTMIEMRHWEKRMEMEKGVFFRFLLHNWPAVRRCIVVIYEFCGVRRVWEYTITQSRSVRPAVLASVHTHYCVRYVAYILVWYFACFLFIIIIDAISLRLLLLADVVPCVALFSYAYSIFVWRCRANIR